MNYEQRRRIVVSRAISGAIKQGLDPVISPELFRAEVRHRVSEWKKKNGGGK